MSNSKLASVTLISPNKNSPRNKPIDRISIHCFVGQVTAKRGCEVFQPTSKKASCNYVVGYDGSIGLCVDEGDRSWCTSSAANDHRAVTIETASDNKDPYAVTDKAYAALLDLVEDICRRNGKTKLLWLGDKDKTLAFKPAADEMVLTVHRWFANKACPGQYLLDRHPEIAAEVTRRLGGDAQTSGTGTTQATDNLYRGRKTWADAKSQVGAYKSVANAKRAVDSHPGYAAFDGTGKQVYPEPETSFRPYQVQVTTANLRIRTGPGTNYAATGGLHRSWRFHHRGGKPRHRQHRRVGQAQERSRVDQPGLRQENLNKGLLALRITSCARGPLCIGPCWPLCGPVWAFCVRGHKETPPPPYGRLFSNGKKPEGSEGGRPWARAKRRSGQRPRVEPQPLTCSAPSIEADREPVALQIGIRLGFLGEGAGLLLLAIPAQHHRVPYALDDPLELPVLLHQVEVDHLALCIRQLRHCSCLLTHNAVTIQTTVPPRMGHAPKEGVHQIGERLILHVVLQLVGIIRADGEVAVFDVAVCDAQGQPAIQKRLVIHIPCDKLHRLQHFDAFVCVHFKTLSRLPSSAPGGDPRSDGPGWAVSA